MENIGHPIHKDSLPELSVELDLRTLDELVRLAEIRIHELEMKVALLQIHATRLDVKSWPHRDPTRWPREYYMEMAILRGS